MGVISQNGIDYPVPSVPVQSDGSATDLTNAAVPTGQTIKSYLNSNLANTSFASINFATNPQTYVNAGTMKIATFGKICIITFVDLAVVGSPANDVAIITSDIIPTPKYEASTILTSVYGGSGIQKVHVNANIKAIGNYWTGDSQRGQGAFHGQLVYVIA